VGLEYSVRHTWTALEWLSLVLKTGGGQSVYGCSRWSFAATFALTKKSMKVIVNTALFRVLLLHTAGATHYLVCFVNSGVFTHSLPISISWSITPAWIISLMRQ
jgi:hypothetical protein